jgi:hypothetical protein
VESRRPTPPSSLGDEFYAAFALRVFYALSAAEVPLLTAAFFTAFFVAAFFVAIVYSSTRIGSASFCVQLVCLQLYTTCKAITFVWVSQRLVQPCRDLKGRTLMPR